MGNALDRLFSSSKPDESKKTFSLEEQMASALENDASESEELFSNMTKFSRDALRNKIMEVDDVDSEDSGVNINIMQPATDQFTPQIVQPEVAPVNKPASSNIQEVPEFQEENTPESDIQITPPIAQQENIQMPIDSVESDNIESEEKSQPLPSMQIMQSIMAAQEQSEQEEQKVQIEEPAKPTIEESIISVEKPVTQPIEEPIIKQEEEIINQTEEVSNKDIVNEPIVDKKPIIEEKKASRRGRKPKIHTVEDKRMEDNRTIEPQINNITHDQSTFNEMFIPVMNQLAKDLIDILCQNDFKISRFDSKQMKILYDYMYTKF